MKKFKRIVLTLVMVCIMLLYIPATAEASATDVPQYKKAVLNFDMGKIRAVGCQSGGQACACFSLAYCTTILDNGVHYYSEYNLGTSQADAICGWYLGGYLNDCFPTNINEAYRIMYDQIVSGNPVVVKVKGTRSGHHYVAVVGVENVSSYESLSASNFLILDPGYSPFNLDNMGTVGYDLKLESGVYQIVHNGTGKTVGLQSVEYTTPPMITETYPSYCVVRATKKVYMKSMPCSEDSDPNSKNVGAFDKGTLFVATGLVKNKYDNLWYKARTADGSAEGYLYAGDVEYVVSGEGDIQASGVTVPANHAVGHTYTLTGDVSSIGNKITAVSVYIHEGTVENGTGLTGGWDSVSGNYYSFGGSTIDYQTRFNDLPVGTYTYIVRVDYENCYATSAKNFKTNTGSAKLYEETFHVVNASHTCDRGTYLYFEEAHPHRNCYQCSVCGTVWAANDTSNFYSSCSECQNTGETTSCSHSYYSEVTKNASCTANGTRKYSCGFCGSSYTETIPANGQHSYSNGSCVRCGYRPTGVKITKQPVSMKAVSGKTVGISVTAKGEGLKYQWYYANKGATTFTKSTSSAATTNTYLATMRSDNNGRRLYCVITDKYGNKVQTNTVTITMIAKPTITKQPVSMKAVSGKTVGISVTAKGEGLKYQWYYANKGATTFTKSTSSAATTNTYLATMRSDNNGRRLYCVITDKYGNKVQTNTVTITMIAKPTITKQPVSMKAVSGKTVGISVTAKGEGLKYQWYYANKGATTFTKSTSSAATTNTYLATMRSANNGRRLYCVITDKYGNKVQTNTVTITMIAKPTITKQPVSMKAVSGKTVGISVTAKGEGLKYQWYYANKGATTFTKSTSSAATTNTYLATMRSDNNGRRLYCVITDKYGNKVQTNTVTIGIPAKPAITKQPISVKAAKGKAVKISVTATGEGLKYQWYYANKGTNAFSKSDCTSNTYSATMRVDNNGRRLYCVITDKYGQTVKTNTVTLTTLVAAKITSQPVSAKVANGKRVNVSLTAVGDGLQYQWYYADKGDNTFTKSTCTGDTYSTTMKNSRNGRRIYCVITDKYGNTVISNCVTLTKK